MGFQVNPMSVKRKSDLLNTNDPSDDRPIKKRRISVEENGLDEDNGISIKQNMSIGTEPILLNVGGIKYSTLLGTLTGHSDCMLNKMFNGSFSMDPSKDGSYFIDRDGEYFKYILNYLRN